jgi:hypothetical protein
MPLDPLSALSIAATVIQFVDFASKIVSKGKHIYKSTDGVIRENGETETVTLRLRDMANDVLQQSKPLEYLDGLDVEELSQDHRLQNICRECSRVSEELLLHLGSLKVPKGTEHRKWKSFRQALKSVWSKQELDAVAKRLDILRNELDTQILVLLR